MKYRKRPIEVEAFQWTGKPEHGQPDWIIDAILDGVATFPGDGTCKIRTLEGDHLARAGDYIIKGVQGELYPCKPDIFAATYEPVGGEQK